jgi:putative ABC transport system permease protein
MRLLTRLRNLFRPRALERGFDEELRFHFDMRVERNVRRGMTRPAAEAEARRHMGSTLRAREGMHDARVVPWLESLGRDLTYAFRSLARQRAFTAVAVVTIAFGIGANTAIYSVLQAVWIDAVPFRDPERLVLVRQYQRSWDDFAALRDENRSFTDLVAFQRRAEMIEFDGEPRRVGAMGTTDAVFAALGVRPLFGRPFTASDLAVGAPPVVLLTYGFWQDSFGGDPDVVGRPIRMRSNIGGKRVDQVATIVGVMPQDARVTTWESALWMPIPPADRMPEGRGVDRIVGRLRPDASVASAREDTHAITARLDSRRGASFDPESVHLVSLRDDVVGIGIGQSLFLLMGATSIVLLIACANVANLFLARGLDLRRETAVRAAIGAGRARLIRQSLIENSLVAGAGCALGVAIAAAARDALVAVMPYNLPRTEAIAIDWRVMLFSGVLAAGTAILTGLVPSLRSSSVRPTAILSSAGSQSTTTPRRRIAHALVAAEVALSVVVLAAAGLLVGSFLKLTATDPGFAPRNLASFRANPSSATGTLTTDTALRLLDELSRAPEVMAAAITSTVPFEGGGSAAGVRVPGGSKDVMASIRTVSAGYFETVGMALRSGRDFRPTEGPEAPPVVIVNERAARQLWPDRSAVGQRLHVWGLTSYHTRGGPVQAAPAVVVGVVNDARYAALDREPVLEVYASLSQIAAVQGQALHVFVVRTTGTPVQVIQRLEPRIKELTGNAVSSLTALDTFISRSVHVPRFRALLFGLMGVLVVVLTAVGVFSVTAHVVAQRRREMGIRMAIGAQSRQLLRLTLRQTSVPVIVGAALGIAGALATTTLVAQFLYATSPTDPATLALVVGGVITIAMIAAAVPARRTLRIDPLDVLRLD